jgi:3-deoxy-D-manno-octulosonic-acid transferase
MATVLRPVLGRWDVAERLARGGEPLPRGLRPLWLHAASVGELSTLRPLVAEILRSVERIDWGLTTLTRTGEQAAAEQFPDTCFRRLLPLDVWPATDRFLDAVHPGAVLFVETEIWPRLILSLQRQGVPVCIASARLSESSMRGYRRFRGLFRSVLGSVDFIGARSEEDRARFVELGADPQRTVALGNAKLDDTSDARPELGPTRGQRLQRLAAGRPIVVWGSLRPGEESIAIRAIRATGLDRGAFWVLAPRHPAEFDRVTEQVATSNLRTVRWSAEEDGDDGPTDVLILDTLGELRAFYAQAAVAVVGGSFGEYGGHNVMEPASLGIPVLFGPDTGDWPEDSARLIESGGGIRVPEADRLDATLAALLTDTETRREKGRAAREAADAGRGASRRTVEALLGTGFFTGVTRGA